MRILIKRLVVTFSLLLTLATAFYAQNPVSATLSVSPGSVAAGGRGTARISTTISGDWKMYSITQGAGGPIPTRITLGEGPFTIGKVSGPRPKVAMDPNFGINTETYTGGAAFTVPFTVDADAAEGPATLNANLRFQVCNDTVCLPPRTLRLSAPITILPTKAGAETRPSPSPSPTPRPANTTDVNSNTEAVNSNTGIDANVTPDDANTADSILISPDGTVEPMASEQDPAAARTTESTLSDSSIWGFIWLAMTFGALSLLTPCVFPMIPITVSYFTKHSADSHGRSVVDALIFVFGIILTFSGLGIALALLFGAAGITRFAANPYTNLLITGIFLAFAFSLLGAYNFGVPAGVLTKLDNLARSKNIGKTIALLLMGLTFSLTSFTCTVPLVGVILVAAAQGELFYPVVGMIAFSSVFALPFFVLAVAPRLMQSLPKAGSWMNSVKVVMGFLEIGAALKFISNVDLVWGWNIFTREIVIAGWIALSIMIFLYLLGVFRFFHDSDESRIGLVRVMNAFFFGTLTFYLLTGLFGNRLGEIESFLPPAKVAAGSVTGGQISGELAWITNDLEKAQAQAKAENKRLFIDFTGYTCTNCRWMEANMFPRPNVTAELEKFVRVKLFTDGEGEPYEGFQRMQEERFGTVALPLYVILTPEDQVVAKFEGLTRQPEEFIAFLQK